MAVVRWRPTQANFTHLYWVLKSAANSYSSHGTQASSQRLAYATVVAEVQASLSLQTMIIRYNCAFYCNTSPLLKKNLKLVLNPLYPQASVQASLFSIKNSQSKAESWLSADLGSTLSRCAAITRETLIPKTLQLYSYITSQSSKGIPDIMRCTGTHWESVHLAHRVAIFPFSVLSQRTNSFSVKSFGNNATGNKRGCWIPKKTPKCLFTAALTYTEMFMLSLLPFGLVVAFIRRSSWKKQWCSWLLHTHAYTHMHNHANFPVSVWVPLAPCFNLCFQAETDIFIGMNQGRNEFIFVFLYKGMEKTRLASLLVLNFPSNITLDWWDLQFLLFEK